HQFTAQSLLAARVERCERARHWTVVVTPKLHHLIWWERVLKVIELQCKLQIGNAITETVANSGFVSPEHGSGHAGGSNMLGDRFEDLPDESTGGPIRHGNHAARPAHAGEFGRDEIRTRSEHRPDQADDGIKLSISVWQRFSIAFFKSNLQALGRR